MKEIIEYFKTLDQATLFFVIGRMSSAHTDANGGCVPPPPSTHPTPNGDWVCSNKHWVWVPEIG